MLLKLLFVLGLVLVLAWAVYRTLRPFLMLIRRFVETIRHFQKANVRQPSTRRVGERLVQCKVCDTWLPESRALAANTALYCSSDCLKRASLTQRRERVG